MKLLIAIFGMIPDTIEASFLSILITNYLVFESFDLSRKYDLYGFLYLIFVNLLLLVIQFI